MVGRGRQKIDGDKAARLVSFSKRRSGFFKKSKEINMLCGALEPLLLHFPSDLPPLFEVQRVSDDWKKRSSGEMMDFVELQRLQPQIDDWLAKASHRLTHEKNLVTDNALYLKPYRPQLDG